MPLYFPRLSKSQVRTAGLTLFWLAGLGLSAPAQVLNSTPQPAASSPPPAAADSSSSAADESKSQAGSNGDMPLFDPNSETVMWDGKAWNIHDNRIFRARFEKYLNAPEATEEEDGAYRETIRKIENLLAPTNPGGPDIDGAFKLLPEASNHKIDAHLCDSLANAIYNVWLSQREQNRLNRANDALAVQARDSRRNAEMALGAPPQSGPSAKDNDKMAQDWAEHQKMAREIRTGSYLARVTEIEAIRASNKAKKELSEVQAKLQFQGLLAQFFMQRRFEHVIMGSRFYTLICGQGDNMMNLEKGSDTEKVFAKGLGLPPTVSMMEALANEAIRDVDEGVDAFTFLMEKDEMDSASKRLAEAFMVGEYLPKIRTLPRDIKRKALSFNQKASQLLSALEVKDYSLAESLIEDLRAMAKDFDYAKPAGAIETAKTLSNMHLAKARTAAVGGDTAGVETELKEATAIWPRNPKLAEVSGLIFSQSDSQQQAIVDLDHLLSQHNYRQIYNDQLRFIAATATYADRREQLQNVLLDMQKIEGAIIRAEEMSKRGDVNGAWESVQTVAKDFPDDTKLNQMRADLSTKAAEFVHILDRGKDMEDKNETGSALAWYLKALNVYPASQFAQDAIHRLSQEILPDSTKGGAGSTAQAGNGKTDA